MKKIYKQEYFSYHINPLVICPNCEKDATVKDEDNYKQAILECKHCDLKKSGEQIIVFKTSVNLNCPTCGKPIIDEVYIKDKIKIAPVKCGNCHSKFDVKVKQVTCLHRYSSDSDKLKRDSIFGCPYYFQTDFKGKLFWARNREHLLEMENYVSSDLRTRLPYRMRMVEKLPTFIKEAKNRGAILKILQKWKN